MEQSKLKIINQLKAQLESEEQVSEAVKNHLVRRTNEINTSAKERDSEKDDKVNKIREGENDFMLRKNAAEEECKDLMNKIADDNEERKRIDDEENKQESDEKAKEREKMAMDDAARYVQKRWEWYQTEGKFLAKKGKKGRKGKGKKKKK